MKTETDTKLQVGVSRSSTRPHIVVLAADTSWYLGMTRTAACGVPTTVMDQEPKRYSVATCKRCKRALGWE